MENEDKKLILGFCGFRHDIPFPELAKRKDIPHPERFTKEQWYIHKGFAPNVEPFCGSEPAQDLNFYFKYAYPLIPWKFDFLSCWIVEVVNGKDPAEAFGDALLKLIKTPPFNAKS